MNLNDPKKKRNTFQFRDTIKTDTITLLEERIKVFKKNHDQLDYILYHSTNNNQQELTVETKYLADAEMEVVKDVLVTAIVSPQDLKRPTKKVDTKAQTRTESMNVYYYKHFCAADQFIANEWFPQGYFFGVVRDGEIVTRVLKTFGQMSGLRSVMLGFKGVQQTLPNTEWHGWVRQRVE